MMVKSGGRKSRSSNSEIPESRPMREARQAIAAMTASVATNSGTSAHFSDKVEKDIGSRP